VRAHHSRRLIRIKVNTEDASLTIQRLLLATYHHIFGGRLFACTIPAIVALYRIVHVGLAFATMINPPGPPEFRR